MPFIKSLILTTVLSVASTAAKTDCPVGWMPNTFDVTRCCSGNMVVDEQGAYCCVYDMRLYKEALTNTALRYETATATTTSETDWSTLENSCIAEVRFTATDYSAQVSSASDKAEATPTDSSISEVTSTGTTASSTSSGTVSQTSTPTPTSNVAMPLATAGEGLIGGAAFAAALFML
ncbi:uncharacterized protein N7479_001194 [Penicillium vulpinum]|uniref:uncharacterized protein n=1 Tax=Penicillium vulpinum TaxID=29845 RepID=UPI00254992CF|nr:uncharacterized protein N7479_001194 [Penicillium vulpinum]KAJ5971276.1 hypothetical protein N7479_001194 [Penicillium vulpinum]